MVELLCSGNEDQAREERGEGPRTTGEEGAETGEEREETEEASAPEKRLQLYGGISQGRRLFCVIIELSKNDRIFLVDKKHLLITEC